LGSEEPLARSEELLMVGLDPKGDAMAMEMSQFLGRVVFDFPKISDLVEGRHRSAFVHVFVDVLTIALGLTSECAVVEIRSRSEIILSVEHTRASEKKWYTCRIAGALFGSSLARIAEELYASEDFDVEIVLHGEPGCRVLVAMDPVYFRIEAA
jgi:hypothetical protein